jgi:hypothetical protein
LFIPDACLAEQLFHDGEAASQIDALRALAERPIKIQGSMNMSSVYDVSVSELPVRLLSDCLRGSVALVSCLYAWLSVYSFIDCFCHDSSNMDYVYSTLIYHTIR